MEIARKEMDSELIAELSNNHLGHREEDLKNLGIKTFKDMASFGNETLRTVLFFTRAEILHFDSLRDVCIDRIQAGCQRNKMEPDLQSEVITHDLGHRITDFDRAGVITYKDMAKIRSRDLTEEYLFDYSEVRKFDSLRASCIRKLKENYQKQPIKVGTQKIENIITEIGNIIKSEPKLEYIPKPATIPLIKVKGEKIYSETGDERANGFKPLHESYFLKRHVPSTSRRLIDDMKLELYYSLNSKPRGLGVIFTNTTFKFQTGEIFEESFTSIFKLMGLVIMSHKDMTCKQTQSALQEIVRLDLSQWQMLAVAICTHGGEGDSLYGSDGTAYSLYRDVVSLFTPNNCPELAGKPKVFFIQSCRGDKVGSCPVEADGRDKPCVTLESDFLVAHSTVRGYKSCFVTTLREMFEQYRHTYNLMDILTFVNQIVIQKSIGESDDSDKFVQTCQLVSTLTKLVFFH